MYIATIDADKEGRKAMEEHDKGDRNELSASYVVSGSLTMLTGYVQERVTRCSHSSSSCRSVFLNEGTGNVGISLILCLLL